MDTMDQPHKPTEKPNKHRIRKLLDMSVYLVVILVFAVLLKAFVDQMALKNEVNTAIKTTDQVINSVRKQDGNATMKLAYKTFKTENTAETLTTTYKDEKLAKLTSSPSVVTRKIVSNDDAGQAVSIIYQFQSKPAIFARVLVIKPNDAKEFQMAKLEIDSSEAKLIKAAQ